MEGSKTLFFSYKFPMGMRKDFFEIYTQYGHASSKRFAKSGLGYEPDGRGILIRFSVLSGNVCCKALTAVRSADPLTHRILEALTRAA
jgi:hypothetical protein